MHRITLFIIGIIWISSSAYSQAFQEDLNSFKKSIELETEGEYPEAIQSLKKTYKEDSYEYNIRLGWLDYMAGQYTESTTYYQKAISLRPMSLEARYGIAYPLYGLGKTNEILNLYKDILDISPLETKANYKLGLIYYEMKKYKEAEKHLSQVINLYPFDYDTLVLLAWTYYQMGKTNDARLLFQKALLFKPEDESATNGLKLVN